MYKILHPKRDSTVYSIYPDKNTGVDQILELSKIPSGSTVVDHLGQSSYWNDTYLSRIAMTFDVDAIPDDVSELECYLVLTATEAFNTPTAYGVDVHPVSGTWSNGTGYFNDDFLISNGISWRYTHGKDVGVEWDTYGVDYYTEYSASQHFDYESPDTWINVTGIVENWKANVYPNNGLLIKFAESDESGALNIGTIKYFSMDTHTIYTPRLIAYWNDVELTDTGSFTVIGDDVVLYCKNLKAEYAVSEVAKLRLGVRVRYPQLGYRNTSLMTTTYRLPDDSYYQIMDSVTDEVIIPFHDGTRVSCDESGNYIRLDMGSFMPERYYKLIFKIGNGSVIQYVDNNYYFKVKR